MTTDKTSYMCVPRIGDEAPEFVANSTRGPITFPDDFTGKWIILFSHPADFTPVCTSEFMTFATMEEEFKQLNCQLLGLSTDSLYSHIAWLRTIKDNIKFKGMEHVEVKFPLIEDANMEISKKFGMIQPNESNTKPVRAVFFIDPKAIIRAIIFYPLHVGRNFQELKRVLIALKVGDEYAVSTPADWQPGDDVIVPAATSINAADLRMEGYDRGTNCGDWFFCMQPLPLEDTVNIN